MAENNLKSPLMFLGQGKDIDEWASGGELVGVLAAMWSAQVYLHRPHAPPFGKPPGAHLMVLGLVSYVRFFFDFSKGWKLGNSSSVFSSCFQGSDIFPIFIVKTCKIGYNNIIIRS